MGCHEVDVPSDTHPGPVSLQTWDLRDDSRCGSPAHSQRNHRQASECSGRGKMGPSVFAQPLGSPGTTKDCTTKGGAPDSDRCDVSPHPRIPTQVPRPAGVVEAGVKRGVKKPHMTSGWSCLAMRSAHPATRAFGSQGQPLPGRRLALPSTKTAINSQAGLGAVPSPGGWGGALACKSRRPH